MYWPQTIMEGLAAGTILFIVSIVLTWPLVREFGNVMFGTGDAAHHLWRLWQVREAIAGKDGVLETSLLYYPKGTTLLANALGPLLGFIALPFWSVGSEAVYNGVLLFGFWMTGVCMYMLARDLGFAWAIAMFASIFYLVAPLHLMAVYGHLTKVFLGLLPLSVWAMLRAIDLRRTATWTVMPGIVMLLALLHSAEQFLYATVAVAFFALAGLLFAEREQRKAVLLRIALTTFFVIGLSGWLLWKIESDSTSFGIRVNVALQAQEHHPDFFQLFLPTGLGEQLYGGVNDWLETIILAPLETTIFLTWTGIILAILAIVKSSSEARVWATFTILCVVFALGPFLRIAGITHFTVFNIPVILPYAVLTSLPGLDFMRTPGRFMLIGYLGLAITASYGLRWLSMQMRRTGQAVLLVLVLSMLLLETWPQSWRFEVLPKVPDFYRQIAADAEQYGVLDLPPKPDNVVDFDNWHIAYASRYQLLQMTHGKAIATGYLSRYYQEHPIFAQFISENYVYDTAIQPDVRVNGVPVSRYANMLYELARNNYRYVVIHKPQDGDPVYYPGSWGERMTQGFVDEVFGNQQPWVDDSLVAVYSVPLSVDKSTLMPAIVMLEPSDRQHEFELDHRWLLGTTHFRVFSPVEQTVSLEIKPDRIVNPEGGVDLGTGYVTITSADDSQAQSDTFDVGERRRFPLVLVPGSQIITVTVTSELPDNRLPGAPNALHARIDEINLVTQDMLQ